MRPEKTLKMFDIPQPDQPKMWGNNKKDELVNANLEDFICT